MKKIRMWIVNGCLFSVILKFSVGHILLLEWKTINDKKSKWQFKFGSNDKPTAILLPFPQTHNVLYSMSPENVKVVVAFPPRPSGNQGRNQKVGWICWFFHVCVYNE